MVLNILQRRFRDHVAVGYLLLRITEKPERQTEIGEKPAVAAGNAARRVEAAVLPGAVRIAGAQDDVRRLPLLGDLHQGVRSRINPAPSGIALREPGLYELIGFVDQIG